MNQPGSAPDRTVFLQERIHYLEEANRAYVAILDMLASCGDFQADLHRAKDTPGICRAALTQLGRLLPFRSMGLLESQEDGSFALTVCEPEDCRDELLADIDAMILGGTFAWALNRNQAITVPAPGGTHTLLLHVIATQARTSGMFVGQLPNNQTHFDTPSLNALTIVLLSTAHALESSALYTMISDHTHNLEQKVQDRTAELLASQETAEATTRQLKSSNKLLKTLSDTDPLTRLHNRRFLLESLENELHRAQRETVCLALVIMDIDYFKKINDTHGHQNGDLVLTAVAELIRSELRRYDTAARYGGDEFLLVLPETPHAGAVLIAERLRKAVQALHFPAPLENLVVTVSMGIAVFPSALIDGVDSLFRQADDALYQAKHKGRNRVETKGCLEQD